MSVLCDVLGCRPLHAVWQVPVVDQKLAEHSLLLLSPVLARLQLVVWQFRVLSWIFIRLLRLDALNDVRVAEDGEVVSVDLDGLVTAHKLSVRAFAPGYLLS